MKRNLVATYASQLFTAVVGIIMLPFYVSTLGVEAYGVVAFYIALQGWIALLDFGLSPTLGRQAARFRGGAIDAAELNVVFRFVLTAFLTLAALILIVFAVGAPFMAERWLHNAGLADLDAIRALRIMAGVLALRFIAFPLRAFLIGVEDLQWLGTFNGIVTASRSIFVVPAMHIFRDRLEVFFLWQFIAGALEITGLWFRIRAFTPRDKSRRTVEARTLRHHWGFSIAIGLTSTLWVAVTNADKVILSGLLPLREYAIYSIATVAAGGVLLLIAPFATAFGPRMIRVYAEGNAKELLRRYNQTTQLTAVAAFPAALALALFARQTLWAWTGNEQIAQSGANVLTFYAVGNALLAIGGLPLQLQIAAGRLRLHVRGTLTFLVLFLPMLWWATKTHGMNGAGLAWVAINLMFVAFWVPLVHRHFLPGPHLKWLVEQVLRVLGPTAIVATLSRWLLPWPSDRWLTLVELLCVGVVLLGVALSSATDTRGYLGHGLQKIIGGVRS